MPLLGVLFAGGAAVLWGAVYSIDQQILKTTPPLVLLIVNSVLTGSVLIPMLLFPGHREAVLTIPRATWLLIIGSLLLAALANILIFSGIRLLGAPTASVFEVSYPIFILVFSSIFLNAKPTLPFAIGSVLVFIGSAIVLAKGSI